MAVWALFNATAASLQQAKHSYARLRADVNLAVDDHRGDVFISWAEVIPAARRLVAVVQLFRQIGCVIRIQNCRIAVVDSPENSTRRAVG